MALLMLLSKTFGPLGMIPLQICIFSVYHYSDPNRVHKSARSKEISRNRQMLRDVKISSVAGSQVDSVVDITTHLFST